MKKPPVAPWLDPTEQEEVCDALLRYGLIRFSNAYDLPIISGTTDIYINLRNARNHPEAIRYFTKLFSNPLRRLGIDRFVEVPDSMSCLAGPIALEIGIPYITIREQAKEGRVVRGNMIGEVNFGEKVGLVDDVISDGTSKALPYWGCIRAGLNVRGLVVLVDRQQGWQKKFAAEKISLPVWPGMTLHDLRRHLIQTFGVMQRCDPRAEEKNPIIVALDGKSWEEILPLVEQLRTTGCILKVNDLLLATGADWLLPNLSVYGRVMADFKGHDIGNTLENYVKIFRRYPPWAVTVHGSGGEEMIRKVVEALKGTPTKVLVVTVLTSLDPNTCKEIYNRRPFKQVEVLAQIAKRAGAHGLVCSPEEVSFLRQFYPHMTLVPAGVRSEGKDKNDQARTGTPQTVINNGANYFVMGRQILTAPDPVLEMKRVLTEELEILI